MFSGACRRWVSMFGKPQSVCSVARQVAAVGLTPIAGVAAPGKCISINLSDMLDIALNKDTHHPELQMDNELRTVPLYN